MKLLVLVDIHGNISNLKKIESAVGSADYIIIPGDITHFGGQAEAATIIESIASLNKNILAVTGNCDYPDIDEYFESLGLDVTQTPQQINGFTFAGLGGSLPCPGTTPNEYPESYYKNKVNRLAGEYGNDKVVLISHQPPINTLNDKIRNGNHVGSPAIREYIENSQPLVCFCGHIHEGVGIDYIGPTPIVNPGPFMQNKYAIVELFENDVHIAIEKI